jgi:hypothetical protein
VGGSIFVRSGCGFVAVGVIGTFAAFDDSSHERGDEDE